MRHGEVAYFEPDGRPVRPESVSLTRGRRGTGPGGLRCPQRSPVRPSVASGLPRTIETARSSRRLWNRRPGPISASSRPAGSRTFRRTQSSRRSQASFAPSSPGKRASSAARRSTRSSTASCRRSSGCSRTRAGTVLLAVLHGGVNRAILSYALTGERTFLGNFEQAPACVNILDAGADHWIVRAVGSRPTTSPT